MHGVHEPLRTITAANCGELMLAMPELAPFITEHANASNQRTMDAGEPLRTVCAGVKGGHFSVVTPILAGVGGRAGQSEPRSGADPLYTMTAKADTALVAPVLVQTGYGERAGQAPRALDLQQPLGTVVAGGIKHAVVSPHLVKFRGDSIGTPVTDPVPTITSGAGAARPAGAAHALGIAAASLVTLRRNMVGADARAPLSKVAAQAEHNCVAIAFLEQANGGFYEGGGRDARNPVSTITATGSQQQLVTADLAHLSPEHQEGPLWVAAFLIKYYGTGANVPSLTDPAHTITTKDRLALVTVVIKGTPYVIVDIGLRMLKPHELYRGGLHHRPHRRRHSAHHQRRSAHGRQQRQPAAPACLGGSQFGSPGRAATGGRMRASLDLRSPQCLKDLGIGTPIGVGVGDSLAVLIEIENAGIVRLVLDFINSKALERGDAPVIKGNTVWVVVVVHPLLAHNAKRLVVPIEHKPLAVCCLLNAVRQMGVGQVSYGHAYLLVIIVDCCTAIPCHCHSRGAP